jgi:hypothetical protein
MDDFPTFVIPINPHFKFLPGGFSRNCFMRLKTENANLQWTFLIILKYPTYNFQLIIILYDDRATLKFHYSSYYV